MVILKNISKLSIIRFDEVFYRAFSTYAPEVNSFEMEAYYEVSNTFRF